MGSGNRSGDAATLGFRNQTLPSAFVGTSIPRNGRDGGCRIVLEQELAILQHKLSVCLFRAFTFHVGPVTRGSNLDHVGSGADSG